MKIVLEIDTDKAKDIAMANDIINGLDMSENDDGSDDEFSFDDTEDEVPEISSD